jgi:carboxypeptidase family protein
VPSASIACTNAATGSLRSVQTNQDGIFAFPDLPIGTDSVEVSRQGFASEKRQDISLLTGQNLDLKFDLKIATAAERP